MTYSRGGQTRRGRGSAGSGGDADGQPAGPRDGLLHLQAEPALPEGPGSCSPGSTCAFQAALLLLRGGSRVWGGSQVWGARRAVWEWVGCGAGRGWRDPFPRALPLSGAVLLDSPFRGVGFHPVLLYQSGAPVGISEGAKSWSGGHLLLRPWALLTPQSRCHWLLTAGHWLDRNLPRASVWRPAGQSASAPV